MWFSYNPLKFNIVNADFPFCKRGHNLETEAKLNKAQHLLLNEVFMDVGADFQLIPSEGARERKRRKTFHEVSVIRC